MAAGQAGMTFSVCFDEFRLVQAANLTSDAQVEVKARAAVSLMASLLGGPVLHRRQELPGSAGDEHGSGGAVCLNLHLH